MFVRNLTTSVSVKFCAKKLYMCVCVQDKNLCAPKVNRPERPNDYVSSERRFTIYM